MGVDKPLSVSAGGGRFAVGGMSDQPDVLQVTYEYPGFILSYETINTNGFGAFARTAPGMRMHGARGELHRPNGMAFYGSNATLVADRLGYEILPEGRPRPGSLAVRQAARRRARSSACTWMRRSLRLCTPPISSAACATAKSRAPTRSPATSRASCRTSATFRTKSAESSGGMPKGSALSAMTGPIASLAASRARHGT